jgi:hypothetical protein
MLSRINISKNKLILAVLYISLPLLLIFTNPNNLPLPLLILPAVDLFLIIYLSVYILISKIKKPHPVSRTRTVIISGMCALVPVVLLALSSTQEFTAKDIILVTILVIAISWYLIRVDFLSR